jgi:phenylalanyl-tRNA synthetase alpha chain
MIDWMTVDPKTLHEIERKLIKALANGKLSLQDLIRDTGLSVDQVRRGIEWLKYKNLIIVSEKTTKSLGLGSEGSDAVAKGLPERRLVNATKSNPTVSIKDAKQVSGLTDTEFNVAFANAIKKKWISTNFLGGSTEIKTSENIPQGLDEKLLSKLASGNVPYESLNKEELSAYQFLIKRPHYLVERETKLVEVELSQEGLAIVKDVEAQPETRAIDVAAPAPIIYAGRRHPLQDVVDEVREIFVGLGFEEIDGPMIQSGFWNFDVLFTPQDHPAREMQDTFYLSGQHAGNVADKRIVGNVASIHKKGWGYNWRIEDAKKLVLRTHTTPVTIRYLADKKPEQSRVFSVGRVFRNEKLTYKHLAEFYQVEGIVVRKDVTLRDLMGLQTQFYSKMGLRKVKFWPSFFPYTEPSLQSMVYHEKLGKWVELFGMGIFRPEVTLPLGVKNSVLAWGGGLERIAMLQYGLDDVRELYSNKLGWLRSVPKCQL